MLVFIKQLQSARAFGIDVELLSNIFTVLAVGQDNHFGILLIRDSLSGASGLGKA